ncbi:hypothetical protein [Bradyrhizobium sp. HKCCYLRH1030]
MVFGQSKRLKAAARSITKKAAKKLPGPAAKPKKRRIYKISTFHH